MRRYDSKGSRAFIRRLHPTTGRFRDLNKTTRAKSVASLHLKPRTVHVLRRAGIQTIGQFTEWSVERSPPIFPGAGEETLHDLENALASLRSSRRPDGTIDWIDYARTRQLTILPHKGRDHWTPRAFIEKLPSVANTAVEIRFGTRGSLILRTHLLIPASQRTSLAQTARNLGLTRERVRKIAADIVDMFRGIIREDAYCGCAFRLRSDFLRPLSILAAALERTCDTGLSESDWESTLAETWRIRPQKLGCAERLILEILGLREVHLPNAIFRPVISTRKRGNIRLLTVLRQIKQLLTVRYPHGLGPEELVNALRNELGSLAPRRIEIPALIRSIPAVEDKKVDGRYRARAGNLKNPADHYERLLSEAGKPLHFEEIARRAHRIGRLGLVKGRCVSNILAADSRFVPVAAQAGFWALAEWRKFETRTITDIAAALIEKAGCPVDENLLYTLIRARRTAAKPSIPALLRRDSRFERAGAKRWALRKIGRIE
jgi:hypothetical protein